MYVKNKPYINGCVPFRRVEPVEGPEAAATNQSEGLVALRCTVPGTVRDDHRHGKLPLNEKRPRWPVAMELMMNGDDHGDDHGDDLGDEW